MGVVGARWRDRRRIAREAWQRLRGGELTPARAAASVAIGLAVGVTPLWGLHWLIVLGVCMPLRLDVGVAFLASNISLPFIAPFITFAELEAGSRLVRGTWLTLHIEDMRSVDPRTFARELAVGTAIVAMASATIGAALTYALMMWRSLLRR